MPTTPGSIENYFTSIPEDFVVGPFNDIKLCPNLQTLRHCILTVFNIFAIAVFNMRSRCLRDDADFEMNLNF